MAHEEPDKQWSATGVQFLVRNRSGIYYARGYRGSKQVWQSLRTRQISVAKVRLADWLREHRQQGRSSDAAVEGRLTFGETARLHLLALEENINIKEATRHYWRQVLRALTKSWTSLEETDVRRVTSVECRTWAAKYARAASATRFNNTVALLRHVFEHAVAVGAISRNPARELKRKRVKPKELVLPSQEDFTRFVESIRTAGAWRSRACADMVEFLAFTGCRIGEANLVCWRDVNLDRGEIVVRGEPVTGTKNWEIRRVPLIPAAKRLFGRLRAAEPSARPEQRVLKVRECRKAMDHAAAKVGMARITHHDLRHLFATVCIEAGTDIPTVARWLGHKDGGVLAMKTYGHLRDEHSQKSAAKIQFGSRALP